MDDMTPTTLRDLLAHEEYKAFFRRAPKAHMTTRGLPWAVVAVSHDDKYGKVYRPTFAEAFAKGKEILKRDDIRDISIFCRNRITPPPSYIVPLMDFTEEWCGRCRRPTEFLWYGKRHPAMKDLPVIVEGQHRCYFCGVARSPYHMGVTRIDDGTRMELA